MALKNSTKKSVAPVGTTKCPELELPDWSGMDDASARITPEAAFRLCEQYPLLISKTRAAGQTASEKCIVEFVL